MGHTSLTDHLSSHLHATSSRPTWDSMNRFMRQAVHGSRKLHAPRFNTRTFFKVPALCDLTGFFVVRTSRLTTVNAATENELSSAKDFYSRMWERMKTHTEIPNLRNQTSAYENMPRQKTGDF